MPRYLAPWYLVQLFEKCASVFLKQKQRLQLHKGGFLKVDALHALLIMDLIEFSKAVSFLKEPPVSQPTGLGAADNGERGKE